MLKNIMTLALQNLKSTFAGYGGVRTLIRQYVGYCVG